VEGEDKGCKKVKKEKTETKEEKSSILSESQANPWLRSRLALAAKAIHAGLHQGASLDGALPRHGPVSTLRWA